MLLQSGHHLGADQLYHQSDTSNGGSAGAYGTLTINNKSKQQTTPQHQPATPPATQTTNQVSQIDQQRYLELVQSTLTDEWTVHTAKDGRLYYCK